MHIAITEPVVNLMVCGGTDLCRQAPSRSIGDCRGPYIQWWPSPVPGCIQGRRQTPPQLPLPTCCHCWSGYRTSRKVRSSGLVQMLSREKKAKVFPNWLAVCSATMSGLVIKWSGARISIMITIIIAHSKKTGTYEQMLLYRLLYCPWLQLDLTYFLSKKKTKLPLSPTFCTYLKWLNTYIYHKCYKWTLYNLKFRNLQCQGWSIHPLK